MTKNRGSRGHQGRYKTDPVNPPNLLDLSSFSLQTNPEVNNETTMTHSINFSVPYTSDELFIVPQPRFKFLDEVAVSKFYEPEVDLASWVTGIIIAIRLELHYWPNKQTLAIPPYWTYQIREMDLENKESLITYWYEETELVTLASLTEEVELEIQLALDNLQDIEIEATTEQ